MRYYNRTSILSKGKTAELVMIYLSIITIYVSLLANFSLYYFTPALKVYWLFVYILFYFPLMLVNPNLLTRNKRILIAIVLGWSLFYFSYVITNQSFPQGGISVLAIECIMIVALKTEVLKKIFYVFCWTFSLFLVISCVEFIFFIIYSKGIVLAMVEREVSTTQVFYHLPLNVVNAFNLFPRFQSLTEEPGLLGTLCAFLLFPTDDQKSLRFPWYVFLISGLLSFSLAFYVLASIFFISKIKTPKNLVAVFIIALIGFNVFKDHVNRLIIERTSDTEEIDNRTTETFDRLIHLSYINNTLWLGNGDKKLSLQLIADGGNAGGKAFIYKYGIINTCVLFLAYSFIFIAISKSIGKESLFFLIVFWASFYQRQTIYTPYTMIVFIGEALLLGSKVKEMSYNKRGALN